VSFQARQSSVQLRSAAVFSRSFASNPAASSSHPDTGSRAAAGGSSRSSTGEASSTSTGTGTSATTAEAVKEKIKDVAGDIKLPAADSNTVLAALLLLFPLILWMSPDRHALVKEAKEREHEIKVQYHHE